MTVIQKEKRTNPLKKINSLIKTAPCIIIAASPETFMRTALQLLRKVKMHKSATQGTINSVSTAGPIKLFMNRKRLR